MSNDHPSLHHKSQTTTDPVQIPQEDNPVPMSNFESTFEAWQSGDNFSVLPETAGEDSNLIPSNEGLLSNLPEDPFGLEWAQRRTQEHYQDLAQRGYPPMDRDGNMILLPAMGAQQQDASYSEDVEMELFPTHHPEGTQDNPVFIEDEEAKEPTAVSQEAELAPTPEDEHIADPVIENEDTETELEVGVDETGKLWEYAIRILQENAQKYLVEWEDHPETGEKYPPSWVWKENVTAGMIKVWKKQKRAKRTSRI